VIAAETIGRSWFEYTQENVRRQSALIGEPLDQVDGDVRAHVHCAYHFYLQHESADEVAKLGKTCKEMIASNAGMPYPYMQQIGDINLAKQWKQIEAPVLVIYGTSDPATSADEGRYLVGIINSFHPGNATYREIAGMGHEFGRYEENPRNSNPLAKDFGHAIRAICASFSYEDVLSRKESASDCAVNSWKTILMEAEPC